MMSAWTSVIPGQVFHQANTEINESETAEEIVPPIVQSFLLQIRLEMELYLQNPQSMFL